MIRFLPSILMYANLMFAIFSIVQGEYVMFIMNMGVASLIYYSNR